MNKHLTNHYDTGTANTNGNQSTHRSSGKDGQLTATANPPKVKWLYNQDVMQMLHISSRTLQTVIYPTVFLDANVFTGNQIYWKY